MPAASVEKSAQAHRKNYPPECVIDGCGRPTFARGWCQSHYSQWRKTGEPSDPPSWGTVLGYHGVHIRARKALPKECLACGSTGPNLQAALRRDAKPDSLLVYHHPDGKVLNYSIDPDDYIRLCATCHKQYDSADDSISAPIARAVTLRAP